MTSTTGIHHLAIATQDIKAQIQFFNDVLGCELVALYWMHGVDGAWHGFMKLNDSCYFAFVETPEVQHIERTIGVTHAGNGALPCAGGAMQHVALNVDSHEDLLDMRDRIRSRGVNVFGPIDHGMCQSIYFAGPEDLSLELATSPAPVDGRSWIDPEVVALAGISVEELEQLTQPKAYVAPVDAVPQPPLDESKPQMRGYPLQVRAAMVEIPDDVMTAEFSMSEPPVPAGPN